MSTRRITIAQPDGAPSKSVAFLDDVTLTGLTGSGLITVTGTGTEKTVTTDATKLTLQDGDVKVMTPIVLNPGEEAPATTTNTLYSVDNTTTNKLYWNGNALATETWAEASFADLGDFNTLSSRVTTAESDIDTLEGKVATIEGDYIKDITDSENTQVQLHFGNSLEPNTLTSSISVTTATQDSTTKALSGTGLVTGAQAQDAINAGISAYNTDVVGTWSTISDKTVKAAIEENKAGIAAEATRATTVENAIKTDIGNWTSGGKYDTMAVKTAIESLAAVSMFKVVSELPETGETNTIYIVKPEGSTEGPYEEYIWVDGKFEKIGDTDIQLQNYYKKTEIGSGFDTTNTVKDYIDAETDRAEGVEDGLDTRLAAAEGKLAGITDTVKAYVDAETDRAEGVEGTLTDLTTDVKTNLVAAINEVDAHADAAQTAAGAAQTDVDALEEFVGTLPAGATATTVVGYVDEKAEAAADGAVDALKDTADTASASDAAGFVTVGLTGTVGNHGLTVSTSNVAKASEIGNVTDLETTDKDSIVAAVNEVNTKASSALQTVTSGDTTNIQVTKSGTNAVVTPIGTLADLLAYCSFVTE